MSWESIADRTKQRLEYEQQRDPHPLLRLWV